MAANIKSNTQKDTLTNTQIYNRDSCFVYFPFEFFWLAEGAEFWQQNKHTNKTPQNMQHFLAATAKPKSHQSYKNS